VLPLVLGHLYGARGEEVDDPPVAVVVDDFAVIDVVLRTVRINRGRLLEVGDVLLSAADAPRTHWRPDPSLSLPMGSIQSAIVQVLRAAERPLTPRVVRVRVEERLRRTTCQNTVSSFLSVACRAADSPVQRCGRALYRIAD